MKQNSVTDQQRHLAAGARAGSRYVLSVGRRLPRGASGLHSGARAGSSLEFKEHRDYHAGDDLRHLDWNAYARSDQLVVKVFHEEVNPRLEVILDGSRSMALAGTAKARAALGLAAFFTAAAENAGFAHAVWVTHAGFQFVGGSEGSPSNWQPIEFNDGGNPAEAVAQHPPAWRPRSLRVLLSDLLWMGDPLPFLSLVAERATSVVVVQILGSADLQPPERGSLRLQDVETGQAQDLLLDGAMLRRYRQALERHQEQWHLACRQVGASFCTLVAENTVKNWRLDELVSQEILRVL